MKNNTFKLNQSLALISLFLLFTASFYSCGSSEKEKYFKTCEQNLTEPNFTWQEGTMYYSFSKDGTIERANLGGA